MIYRRTHFAPLSVHGLDVSEGATIETARAALFPSSRTSMRSHASADCHDLFQVWTSNDDSAGSSTMLLGYSVRTCRRSGRTLTRSRRLVQTSRHKTWSKRRPGWTDSIDSTTKPTRPYV
ncbi:hypothetical protein, variant [Aphanomyces astaci]|uniref:Uncharacterized protein n=1 Tax=Aphanomyces astaci TaxID=112090 RepID=W4G756_APHAT|nr:hypothetical protein, variant [Aphanomyces astaci]ETV75500.1 hypothetical protein, variant [Aphanomyces astaci]|eukprot:XP_009835134.1 hypothetical protein, variant [Aphanomyces astaci]